MSDKSGAHAEALEKYQSQDFPVFPVFGIDKNARQAKNADLYACRCPDGAACTRSPGKHPNRALAPHGFKNATRDPAVLRSWLADKRCAGSNWAIATGVPLTSWGGYLVVLDVDPRNAGDETLSQLEAKYGKLPDTMRVLTGRGDGGTHYYFRSPVALEGRTLGPGLDFKGVGGYVLAPPSTHESGGQYTWDVGGADDLADMPSWMLEGGGGTTLGIRPQWSGASARDTLLGAAFEAAGMLGTPAMNGAYSVRCPWLADHSDGRGDGTDTSTVILPPIAGTHFGSFHCSHSHCHSRKYNEVLAALPTGAVIGAKIQYPLKPTGIAASAPDVVAETVPDALATASAPPVPSAAVSVPARNPVLDLFAVKQSAKGNVTIIPDRTNAVTMLTYDSRWLDADGQPLLRYDEFRNAMFYTKTPPWHPDDAPEVQLGHWVDADAWRIGNYATRYYQFEIKEAAAYQAAILVAKRHSYHPVRTYLESLKWDNVPRIDTWLTDYLGVPNTSYASGVGKWWIISAVARIMDPGCKVDHVLILEGEQGLLKSTALRTLAGNPDWFSDSPLDIGNKDAFVSIQGRWIIELAELDGLGRHEATRIKAFFSSAFDTFRAPYDKATSQIPRQCVFCGTVNPGALGYFKDDTGNRRFWPVACGKIDIARLNQDRDQLWAEALHQYRAGERWWPQTQEEKSACASEQDERADSDAWENQIASWITQPEAYGLLESRKHAASAPNGYLTMDDILGRVLRLPVAQWDRASQMRVGRSLLALGWIRGPHIKKKSVYVKR